jgi:type II secretory pathway pseudopilin PulG
MMTKRAFPVAISLVLIGVLAAAQAAYTPKFKGDPARSDSEAAALGYMRTFLRAQKIYKKKNGHYAETLMQLTKTGSFTRRMASPDRGDYTVKFRNHKDKDQFEITMVPKQQDPTHRSFFSDEQGKIRVNEQGDATEDSPPLKADTD